MRRSDQPRRYVVDVPVFDDTLHTPQILDVLQRIALDECQISELAGLDAAEIGADAHRLGGRHGRRPQHLHRREPTHA
jgi:hypothetical protein